MQAGDGPSPSFLPDIEKELGRQKHEHDATLTIGSSLLQNASELLQPVESPLFD